eukprot:PhM_4_TR9531/c0_g1_i1/m.83421
MNFGDSDDDGPTPPRRLVFSLRGPPPESANDVLGLLNAMQHLSRMMEQLNQLRALRNLQQGARARLHFLSELSELNESHFMPSGGDDMDNPFEEMMLRAALQMSLETAQPTGAPPAKAEDIDLLDRRRVTRDLIRTSGQERCVICLDEFIVGSDILFLPCRHIFCPSCVKTWLEAHRTCPVCRAEIVNLAKNSGSPQKPTTPRQVARPSSTAPIIQTSPRRPVMASVSLSTSSSSPARGNVVVNSLHDAVFDASSDDDNDATALPLGLRSMLSQQSSASNPPRYHPPAGHAHAHAANIQALSSTYGSQRRTAPPVRYFESSSDDSDDDSDNGVTLSSTSPVIVERRRLPTSSTTQHATTTRASAPTFARRQENSGAGRVTVRMSQPVAHGTAGSNAVSTNEPPRGRPQATSSTSGNHRPTYRTTTSTATTANLNNGIRRSSIRDLSRNRQTSATTRNR